MSRRKKKVKASETLLYLKLAREEHYRKLRDLKKVKEAKVGADKDEK